MHQNTTYKITACLLYILTGIGVLILGGFYLSFITIPLLILLVVAGILSLSNFTVANRLALIALCVMVVMFTMSVNTLVPMHNRNTWLWHYVAVLVLYSVIVFNLYLPASKRYSHLLLAIFIAAPAAMASQTFFKRMQDGEYNRPSMVFFRWENTSDKLRLDKFGQQWLSPDMRSLLISRGVQGALRWSGHGGDIDNPNRIIVIMRAPLTEVKALHYPKQGHLAYVFDGHAWKSYPENAPVYESSRMSLHPDGRRVMLQVVAADNSTGGSHVMYWPND
jgi:hypothetical protein